MGHAQEKRGSQRIREEEIALARHSFKLSSVHGATTLYFDFAIEVEVRRPPSSPDVFSFRTGTSMTTRPKVNPAVAVKQSEYTIAQKSRASALSNADSERAQKRRDNDALIDVNASKWRYVGPGV
ncbi:hypothetical protein [Caballeronia sp. HLA56]